MADIVINPAIGKIDFFSVKGDNVTNTLKLTGNTLLFTGPLSASSISTGGGGTFVTSVQPTSNYLSKFTGNSTIANSLIYDNGTNVGIGTTTSAARLQINSTTSGATLLRTDGTSGTLFTVVDDLSDSLMSVNNSAGLPVLEVFADDRIVGGQYGKNDFVVINNKVGIGTNNPTAKLQVTSSVSTPSAAFLGGNVGIGTTSPACKLHVDGTIRSSASEIYGFGASDNVSLRAASSVNVLGIYTSNTERLRVDANGNLGIGISNVTRKLIVNGDSAFAVNSGGLVIASYDGDTANIRPSVANGSILISDDSNLLTRGTEFLNGGGMIVQSISGFTPLQVKSDGNTLLFVASGGNVGIGTSSPGYKLHVNGNGYFNSTLVVNADLSLTGGGDVLIYDSDGTGFFASYMDSGVAYMRVDDGGSANGSLYINSKFFVGPSTGNVGIGTTSPISLLDVRSGYITAGTGVSTSGTTILAGYYTSGHLTVLGTEQSSGGPVLGYAVTPSTSATGAFLSSTTIAIPRSAYTQDGGTHRWYTGASQTVAIGSAVSTSEKMRMDINGNIGIGTSTPRQILHINGSILLDGLQNGYEQGSTRAIGYGSNSGAVNTDGFSGMDIQSVNAPAPYGGNYSQNVRFWAHHYGTGTGNTPRMVLQYNGFVGIGTTSPVAKLHVVSDAEAALFKGTATFGSAIQIEASSTGGRIYQLQSSANGAGEGGGKLLFVDKTAAATRLTIDSGGNVGIGTSSPSATLTVIATNNTGSRIQLGTASNNTFMDANKVNDFMVFTAPFGASPASVSNGGAKWGIKMNGSIDTINTKAKSAAVYAVSEETNAGYNRQVGLALHTSGFDLENSEKVRITAGGNVGIGSTAPAYKLDVNGGIASGGVLVALYSGNYNRLYEPAGNPGIYLGNNSDPANYYDNNTHYFRNRGGSSNYAIINSNGNLGIGTTTVPSPLTIYNNADVWHFRLGSAAGELRFGGATNNGAVIQSYTPAGVVRDLYIQRDGGKVGIGTNSPNSPLTIVGDGTPNGVSGVLRVADTGSSKWGSIGLPDVQSTTTSANNFYLIGRGAAYTDRVLSIHIPNTADYGSGAQPKFGVYSTGADLLASVEASTGNSYFKGNVGIGTTNPGFKLEVNGTMQVAGSTTMAGNLTIARAGAYLYINGTNSDAEIIWLAGNANRWAAGMNVGDSTENFNIYNYTTATTNFTILKANGNVGIGSATPAYKLDVNGGLNINGILSVAGVAVLNTSTNANDIYANIRVIRNTSSTLTDGMYINYDSLGTTNAHLRFFANGVTERMRIDASSGNVGIGTTSPAYKFTVKGGAAKIIGSSDNNSGIYLSSTATDRPVVSFRVSDDSERAKIEINNINNSNGDRLGFFVYSGIGLNERMSILGNGNVGIGTTAPISKLNAYASGSNLSVLKIDGGNGTLFEVTDQLSGSLFSVNTIAGLPVMEAFSNNRVVMGKYNANDFVISGSRVGIGTSNPAQLLELKKTTGSAIALLNYNDSVKFNINASSAGAGYLGMVTNHDLIFVTNDTERARLNINGNVGIGTSSPASKLHLDDATAPYITITRTGVPTWQLRNNFPSNQYGFSFNNTTAGTVPLFIGAGGNIGIGLDSPGAKLDIASTQANGIVMRFDTSTNYNAWIRPYWNSNTDTRIDFAINRSAGVTPDVIMSVGYGTNVGIGTTAPVAKLHTVTTTAGSTVIRADGTSGTLFSVVDDLSDSLMSVNNSAGLPVFEVFADDRIVAGQYGVNDFVVVNNKVGIGTNNPLAELHVSGSNGTSIIDGLRIGRGSGNIVSNTVVGNNALLSNTIGTNNTAVGRNSLNVNTTGVGNTAVGVNTLLSNTTGVGNSVLGASALYFNTTGNNNSAFGRYALNSNATGSGNCAFGLNALRSNTTGFNNAFGYEALRFNTIGTNNSAFGYKALRSNTTGIQNSAFGHYALYSNTTSGQNNAFGYQSLQNNISGNRNSAFGHRTLRFNTSGTGNSAFGYTALFGNTTGAKNCAFGAGALVNNTSSKNNAFGYQALYSNFNGARNCAFGYKALYFNTTNNNSAFGYQALSTNTTGLNNSAFGYYSLNANITGNRNCAFGHRALRSNLYSDNTAFGYLSMSSNTVGYQNTAIGTNALQSNTSGGANVAVGYQSLPVNTIGENNVAIGWQCLNSNTTGSSNVAIGSRALLQNTTGAGNCVFGRYAGRDSTAGGNVIIGYFAGSTVTTGTNLTIIGYNAAASTNTVNNEITLGNSGVGTLRCQVTTITALSDFRDKTDINDIQLGLSFVEKLRPVTFKWDRREWYTDGNRDGSKKDSVIQAGFIAQELKALQEEEGVEFLKLVYESNPDKLEATPGNLMIPLIKAVQELSAKVKTLEAKVQILESK